MALACPGWGGASHSPQRTRQHFFESRSSDAVNSLFSVKWLAWHELLKSRPSLSPMMMAWPRRLAMFGAVPLGLFG